VGDAWNMDHPIFRMADDLVPVLKEQFYPWIQSIMPKVDARVKNWSPMSNKHAASHPGAAQSRYQELWDNTPIAEKRMTRAATLAGKKFKTDVLTAGERQKLSQILQAWRGHKQSKLMAIMQLMGVPASAKISPSDLKQAKADVEMQKAVAKAMAWTQVLFDFFGAEKMDVFRGGGPSDLSGLGHGDDAKKKSHSRELTSYSTHPAVSGASSFGNQGYVIKARVDPVRLSLGPHTDPGMEESGYKEEEWLLVGQEEIPVKYVGKGLKGHAFKNYDHEKMKMARMLRMAMQLAKRHPEVRNALRELSSKGWPQAS
jgi:hypothetical protein